MLEQAITQQVPLGEATMIAGLKRGPSLVCWSCRESTSRQPLQWKKVRCAGSLRSCVPSPTWRWNTEYWLIRCTESGPSNRGNCDPVVPSLTLCIWMMWILPQISAAEFTKGTGIDFMLVFVNYTMGHPNATALWKISGTSMAEALFQVIFRVKILIEISTNDHLLLYILL